MQWLRDNKKNVLRWALGLFSLAMLAGAAVLLWPWFSSLSKVENLQQVEAWARELGARGWIVMLGLQVLQIIVAVIPGEPIEILAGMLYGAWGGLFLCELGILIGTLLVFFTVRRFGMSLVRLLFSEEKLRGYKFLQNEKRLETITFILFFLPGTPKDVLTYIAGITPISPCRFLLIALVARIPSVLSSTFGGSSIAGGNLWGSVFIFVAVGLVSLLGIWLNGKLLKRRRHK